MRRASGPVLMLRAGVKVWVATFVFATDSHAVIINLGRLGLSGRVRVNFVAMIRVSKLLGSNFNRTLTLILP